MKKQNGITLIALIITIIVLLILAGVSINMVIGQNSVLTKAQNAVTENKKATVLEEAQLVLADWQTEYLVNKTPFSGRSTQTASGADVVCGNGRFMVVDTENGKIYSTSITEKGELGAEYTESVNDTTSQAYKAMHPIIPTGYEYVTGEWNTGYVIKETSTNDEFVWIPVIDAASYAKKSGSRNYHMSAQDVADHGKDVVNLYVSGDAYGTNAWITDSASEIATVNNAGGFYVSRYEVGYTNVARTDAAQSGWTTATIKSQKGYEPARNITQEKALELANTWKSVTSGDVTAQSGLITGTQWDTMCNFIGWSICDSDCTSWGNYYNAASKVYGSGVTGHSGIDSNYTYWYTDATEKLKNKREVFATGMFENTEGRNTAQKNIYDVAGNVWEWTTETISRDASKRVLRGGSANDYGGNLLATYRSGNASATDSGWGVGFRAVLYVATATN